MFKKVLMIGAMFSTAISAPVYAKHLTSADTPFTATGYVTLSKPGVGTVTCLLTLNGKTNPDLGLPPPHVNHTDGAVIYGGTNTGPTPCPAITVGPGVVSYDSISMDWVLNPTDVYLAGNKMCEGEVHFTVDAGVITFDSDIDAPASFPGTCHVTGELVTDPEIDEVD